MIITAENRIYVESGYLIDSKLACMLIINLKLKKIKLSKDKVTEQIKEYWNKKYKSSISIEKVENKALKRENRYILYFENNQAKVVNLLDYEGDEEEKKDKFENKLNNLKELGMLC
jgi:hypothetical protein